MKYSQKTLMILSVESEALAQAEHYCQQVIVLVNDGASGIVLFFKEANVYPADFLSGLFAKLLQHQGSAWFINSHIMIDADSEKLKSEITNLVIAMLQAEMAVQSSISGMEASIINAQNWFKLPVIQNRLATQEDVDAGEAVFFLNPELGVASVINLNLPQCAYYHDENDNRIPVILVQAEKFEDEHIVGMVKLDGSKLVGMASQVEIMKPEEFFVA